MMMLSLFDHRDAMTHLARTPVFIKHLLGSD